MAHYWKSIKTVTNGDVIIVAYKDESTESSEMKFVETEVVEVKSDRVITSIGENFGHFFGGTTAYFNVKS